MESLFIEATASSPEVKFDIPSNHYMISGKSRPENTGKFYIPIVKWVAEFEEVLASRKNKMNEKSPVVFIFKMEYFNSISAKYLLDIIFILKDFIKNGHKIEIEWHSPNLDDDMLETGKEFSIMTNAIQFLFYDHF